MIPQKAVDIRYVLISAVVALLNSFFYSNYTIMLLVTIGEIALLLRCLWRREDYKYLCYYIIFLSLSMESASFVGTMTFYGFKNFKVAGVNVGVLCILPILIKLIKNGSIRKVFTMRTHIRKFVLSVVVLTLLGIFMGLVSILVNDNSATDFMTGISMFTNACYIFVFLAVEVVVISCVVVQNPEKINEIKQSLYGIIISVAITIVASLVFHNYGNRGGLHSLQVSNLIMLLTGVILLPFYRNYKKIERFVLTVAALVILVLSLLYNTNGKMILITALVPFMTLIYLIRNKRPVTLVSMFAFLFIIVAISSVTIIPAMRVSSFLFSEKLTQASAMLDFWNQHWLSDLPSSPKMRISEFLNIAMEYYKKPWFLLTGKGYMGTIKDNLLMFGPVNQFAFSNWELETGLYYNMHESLNMLFLTNGLLGLLFFAGTLKLIFKNFNKSPWIMLGGFWFILFYGYSVTISIFGATAFIIGLYDLEASYFLTLNTRHTSEWSKSI